MTTFLVIIGIIGFIALFSFTACTIERLAKKSKSKKAPTAAVKVIRPKTTRPVPQKRRTRSQSSSNLYESISSSFD